VWYYFEGDRWQSSYFSLFTFLFLSLSIGRGSVLLLSSSYIGGYDSLFLCHVLTGL
jgi:hypothetical protein